MSNQKLPPIHPGEILREEFLSPFGIMPAHLAKEISVSSRRIRDILRGKRGITADLALRLARYFATSEWFWLNLQNRFDLEIERDRLGSRLETEVKVMAPVALSEQGGPTL